MKKIWSGIVRYYKLTDKVIWGLCLFSSAFSVLMLLGIWDSDYVKLDRVIVQIVAAGLGCCAMVVISRIDYQTMADLWRLHLPLAYALVGLTFVLGIGRADDMAWLRIPFVGLTFQPSELLKLSFIITFAYHLQKAEDNLNQPGVLVPVLCHAAVPVLLIMLQGDHGSAMVFLFVACGMLFTAGLAWKYILAAGGLSIARPAGDLVRTDGRGQADAHHHPLQPRPGPRRQRLPAAAGTHRPGFGQALGQGGLLREPPVCPGDVQRLYLLLHRRGAGIDRLPAGAGCAHSTLSAHPAGEPPGKDRLGRYICVGVFMMIASQTVMNVGMCLSVLPVIGVTLPLFSGGGTSVVATYLGIGLAMSVSMHNSRRLFTL